jgi:hypothetical protein
MKQKNIIIGAAVLGVAGYFGYRALKKAKDKKAAEREAAERAKNEAEKKGSATTGGGTTGGGTTYQGPSPYQQKVMTLQTRLGIGVDGNPGFTANSQTNRTVASWFPITYARLGNVSMLNIDSYLALGTKKEFQSSAARATQILTALNAGQKATLRLGGDASAMFFDSSANSYRATGGLLTILPGTPFVKSDVVSSSSPNFWIVNLPYKFGGTGKRLVAINPSTWDIFTS